MANLHLYVLFMVGSLALNLAPGPDMAFVLAQSAHRGTRSGLAAALGLGTGALIYTILVAFGLAALFGAWKPAFEIVRYAGAGYLVWIAVSMVRRSPECQSGYARSSVACGLLPSCADGLTQPQDRYLYDGVPAAKFVWCHKPDPAWLQIFALGVYFTVSGTIVNCLVAFGGGRLARRLREKPGIGKVFGWLSASVMVGLALRLAWPERH